MTQAPISDAPVQYPAGWPERLASFIGAVARPLAIVLASYAAAHATIVIAGKVENGNDGAIFAGAYFLGLGTLYLGKAVEAINTARARRDVDVAQVAANTEQTK